LAAPAAASVAHDAALLLPPDVPFFSSTCTHAAHATTPFTLCHNLKIHHRPITRNAYCEKVDVNPYTQAASQLLRLTVSAQAETAATLVSL
jgi:hypothetical protein